MRFVQAHPPFLPGKRGERACFRLFHAINAPERHTVGISKRQTVFLPNKSVYLAPTWQAKSFVRRVDLADARSSS
jgi:hypothetical protein